MNTTARFLLTGAGFTRNFGGPLANEMWGMILSHTGVRALPSLRSRLLAEFDFEAVYHEVVTTGTEAEQEALQAAVSTAYTTIDKLVRDCSFAPGSPFPVNIYKVQELIRAFCGASGQPGFVFTLNQDLFLERHYYNGPAPCMPGVVGHLPRFTTHFNIPLGPETLVTIPDATAVEKLRSQGLSREQFCLLKLHGSCDWRSPDVTQQMVIGRGKEEQIQREPLLSWYFDIFRECLEAQPSRLLTIGYGFGDPHINRVLADCVSDRGLLLFLLTPESPASLRARLAPQPYGEALWTGVAGYYQTTFARLFPANQEVTAEWKMIVEDFFNGRLKWPGSGP